MTVKVHFEFQEDMNICQKTLKMCLSASKCPDKDVLRALEWTETGVMEQDPIEWLCIFCTTPPWHNDCSCQSNPGERTRSLQTQHRSIYSRLRSMRKIPRKLMKKLSSVQPTETSPKVSANYSVLLRKKTNLKLLCRSCVRILCSLVLHWGNLKGLFECASHWHINARCRIFCVNLIVSFRRYLVILETWTCFITRCWVRSLR
jgi:hypothetical protein